MVQRILETTALPPHCLAMEINEGTMMQLETPLSDKETVSSRNKPAFGSFQTHQGNRSLVDILTSLRDMGISIAMNDFGTGYSSLSYLNNFPFDILKIDRSFIKVLNENSDSPIITAIIAMAEKLGLRVVAEGVETDFQKN